MVGGSCCASWLIALCQTKEELIWKLCHHREGEKGGIFGTLQRIEVKSRKWPVYAGGKWTQEGWTIWGNWWRKEEGEVKLLAKPSRGETSRVGGSKETADRAKVWKANKKERGQQGHDGKTSNKMEETHKNKQGRKKGGSRGAVRGIQPRVQDGPWATWPKSIGIWTILTGLVIFRKINEEGEINSCWYTCRKWMYYSFHCKLLSAVSNLELEIRVRSKMVCFTRWS